MFFIIRTDDDGGDVDDGIRGVGGNDGDDGVELDNVTVGMI